MPRGFTRYTGPGKRCSWRLPNVLQDHRDLSVAPISAIDRGLNSCLTCSGRVLAALTVLVIAVALLNRVASWAVRSPFLLLVVPGTAGVRGRAWPAAARGGRRPSPHRASRRRAAGRRWR